MRYLLAVLVIGFGFLQFSCIEEEPLTTLERFNKELEEIDAYIAENGITDTLIHELSRIRYTINTKSDNGLIPRITDSVFVDYEGSLLYTDEVFDSGQNFGIILNQTIDGWQIMLPEMQEGDDFTIYIPSYYGYGTNGAGSSIPPNSPLIFDIKLIRVAN